MAIAVECPHCEETFQLDPDMAGKSMRCPNADCREIFVVQASGSNGVPEPTSQQIVADDSPKPIATETEELPYDRIESNEVGPIEVERDEAPAPVASPLPPEPEPTPRPAKPVPSVPVAAARSVPVAARAPSVPVAARAPTPPTPAPTRSIADGPKEVIWSGHAPPVDPPSPPVSISPPLPAPEVEDEPFIRRRRSNPWPKRILAAFILLLVVVGGSGAFFYLRFVAKSEERDAEIAAETYKSGNFGTAAKQYQSLIDEYPGSNKIEEYRFFAALSETRAAVDAVTARQHPEAPLIRLRAFLGDHGDSPFAQPGHGFGSDIVLTGRKMTDTLAGHAEDRLKESQRLARELGSDWSSHHNQRRTNTPAATELAEAEQAVTDGEALIPLLDRFRDKEGLNFDDQKKKFADLRTQFQSERDRTTAIAPWLDLPDEPTDLKIENFERAMRTAGLAADPEATQIAAWAQAELRKRIVGTPGYRAAEPPPIESSPPVLFTAAVLGSPTPERPIDAVPDVVFARSRGVLYALDAHTGERLWGCRVSGLTADPKTTDLPVRFTLADGRTDWVLVASTADGRPGITARDARTGAPIWHQPLEADLAGRPLVLGRRVYVPLADTVGTVVEIQIATGDRLGSLTIRQRIGAALVGADGAKPGLGRLFVPGDARRVFEFEVGAEADDGTPIPPRLVRDLLTNHPRDSLTGTVLLTGRTSDGGPKYLIVTQADGQEAVLVRCFTLDRGDPPPTAEVRVPGWSSFPAATNGERVVLATDAGTYAVLGVNQEGNVDRPLFPWSGPKPSSDERVLKPSLVVSVSEDSAWVVIDGELVRLRTAVDPVRGMRVVRHGPSVSIGEPIHRAQTRPNLDLGVVVTRSTDGTGEYATGFDLHSGLVRWRQQLGAIGSILPGSGTCPPLLVDENGGLFHAGESAVLAQPIEQPIGPATTLVRDGTVWGLIPYRTGDADHLRIRQVAVAAGRTDALPGASAISGPAGAITACGRMVDEYDLPLPALPAGSPVLVANAIVLPLADGFLYRHTPGTRTLERGPRWKGNEANGDSISYLASLDGDRFLVTDGGRQVALRTWLGGSAAPMNPLAIWETREPIVLAPVVIPSPTARFAVADSSGISLFEEAKPLDPIRRWRGAEAGLIPPGSPSLQLDAVAFTGETKLLYAVNGRTLVCLDPTQREPLWTAPAVPLPPGLELVGWSSQEQSIDVTDQAGRVFRVDAKTGQTLDDRVPPLSADIAAGRFVPLRNERGGLLPTLSGTVIRVPSAGR